MSLNLVPQPKKVTLQEEKGVTAGETDAVLFMPQEDMRLIKAAKPLFRSLIARKSEAGLFCISSHTQAAQKCSAPEQAEGYRLCVDADGLEITARTAAGLFYGIATLAQLCEEPYIPSVIIEDWPDLAMRSDYLDLRGIYPKYENLLAYIAEMGRYKLNTLVVEWEDKLPFQKMKKCRHPKACFTPEQFKDFIETAYDNFIDIIPLQQSFGHLEYALKLPEYMPLRETPLRPGELCPLREGAFELAAELIGDTAALHPHSKYLHLGCDEVWSLGESQECRDSGLTREQISIAFINRLAAETCRRGKIPMVWHDMIGNAPEEEIQRLDKRMVVAVWIYSADLVYRAEPLLKKLEKAGLCYVVCSAVRCYDARPGQNYPLTEKRMQNIDAWSAAAKRHGVKAMIHTNWFSTYSMGNPYGLFETSRYITFYAAEQNWNMQADKITYFKRFMAAYHGVRAQELSDGNDRRFDYYEVVPRYLEQVRKNCGTAELIALMRRYENACAPAYLAFRARLFPGNEVEYAGLCERAVRGFENLREIEKELQALLPRLLSSEMGQLYLFSRMAPVALYKRELEDSLGISL